MSRLDLRLVPSAALTWIAAWTATTPAPAPALATACGWLAAIAGAGAILLLGLRGVPAGGSPGRPGRTRRCAVARSVTAHVALAGACSLAVVAAATVTTARAATVQELAGAGFTAELRGTVASQPEPVGWGTGPSSGRPGTAEGLADGATAGPVRFTVAVHEVSARGVSTPTRARVTVTWNPAPRASAATGKPGSPAPGAGRNGNAAAGSRHDAPDGAAAQALRFGGVVVVRGGLRPAEPGRPEAARLTAEVLTVQRPPPAPLRLLDRHRDALLAVTEDLAPQARGLVPGAAIGDTSRLPGDLAEALRVSGLTHVTAVSGGHFAVVIALLAGIAATLGAPRWSRVALLAVAGAAFVALVRPEPSVLRAAVMAAFSLTGVALGRPAAALPALMATVIGLLAADPALSRSYGFALSAAATAGLVLLVPPLVARIAPWTGRAFAFALAVPLAAQLACGPLLVLLEPEVSLVSVPANLLAAPAVVPATVLGLAATVLAPWWETGAHVVAWTAGLATWWIAQIALHAAALPGRAVPWPGGPAGALLLAAATVAGLALVLRRRPHGWPESWRRAARSTTRRLVRRARPATSRHPGPRAVAGPRPVALLAAGAAVVLALGAVALVVSRAATRSAVPPDWVVAACDVGQGDGLAVRTGPASALVVDVGPDGEAAGDCLDQLGVTHVDLLVLSHYHADHVGGLAAVLDGRRVESALVSPLAEPRANEARARGDLAAAGVPVRAALAGDRGRAGNATWDVLLSGLAGVEQVAGAPGGPGPGGAVTGAGPNDAGVTLLVQVAGLDVVLLGDLEESGQAALLAETRRRGIADVDVVKVAHHGSRVQSPALARQLGPAVALVSAGRGNTYGHPTSAALDLYAGVGAVVLRTDECGTLTLVVRGSSLAAGGC